MPQNDRHRTRVVPIEFEMNEKFDVLPLPERVTLALVSNGKVSFTLNDRAVTLNAPCMLLLSPYDKLKLENSLHLAAKSFSFKPVFVNSSLTFERLAANDFDEMEDEHDRNVMNLFLIRD